MSEHMVFLHVVSDQGDSVHQALSTDSLTVGRSSSADLQLADHFLSRKHARFFRRDSEWWVEDLHSRNGTLLNGAQLCDAKRLKLGDEVQLCRNTATLESDQSTPSPATTVTRFPLIESRLVPRSSELDTRSTDDAHLSLKSIASLRHQADMLHMLNEVHQALGSLGKLEELLDLLLEQAFRVLAPDEVSIFLQQNDGSFYLAARRTDSEVDAEHLHSEKLLRDVLDQGMTALVADAVHDPVYCRANSSLSPCVRSLAAAPLMGPKGPLGVIVITSIRAESLFDDDDAEMLASLGSIAALRIRNLQLADKAAEEAANLARFAEELSLARKIQLNLLPSHLPEIASYELWGANVPSRGVSGDFYTVIRRADGKEFIILMADVSGKGMAASLLTFSLEALAAGPIEVGRSPLEICTKVSRRLLNRSLPSKYATMFLGVLRPESNTFNYVNAGHTHPLIVSKGKMTRWLAGTGPPVALFKEPEYEEKTVHLEPGDLFVLYTDGITEASNPTDDEYGTERLEEVCKQHRDLPLEQLASEIKRNLDTFVSGVPYEDDKTLLLMRRR